MKTEFLQLWDGIRNRVHGGGGSAASVLVIGATNRPFDVDPAFLRRMPRKIYVGLPDFDSRVSVLQGMLRRVPLDVNFDVALVASKTDGYSPSDIREVLQTAALFPLREARADAIMDLSESGMKTVGMPMPPLRRLRTDDVLRALEVSRPTHFSRKYRKELMSYIRNSGVSLRKGEEDRADLPTVSGMGSSDASASYTADADAFFSRDDSNQRESDSSSYDEDSSDGDNSDYDDF